MKKLLYIGLGLAVVLAVAATAVYQSTAGQDAIFKRGAALVLGQQAASFDGLRVVICGSASPLGMGADRAQACIAVVTPEHLFFFDIGARAPSRIAAARLPLARISGVMLTHYHSDHIAGVPDVNLASWVQGRPESMQVYGPPGVQRVVDGFNIAYTLDRTYRTAHHGAEMLPPETGPMTAQTFTPGEVVWEDELMRITSFLVSHPPIEPAVGYRVDYRGRSVVISGDTNAADSLFEAAEGADILLHDALSRTLLDPMIEAAREASVPVLPDIMTDVIDYHADSTTLHERASAAGIRQLAFYHMVPVPANNLAAKMFLRHLPSDVILVDDLQVFDLPPDSDEIRVHNL